MFFSVIHLISMVSIHAPAKGATGFPVFISGACKFQSTLPRRERHMILLTDDPEIHVSIHAPAKGATLHGVYGKIYIKVSIHAPAKGATSLETVLYHGRVCFNPRSREGSDGLFRSAARHDRRFNPRSREGSDNNAGVNSLINSGFNPRSREGSDEYSI